MEGQGGRAPPRAPQVHVAVEIFNTATQEFYEKHGRDHMMKMKHLGARAREHTLCGSCFLVCSQPSCGVGSSF
eukprot:2762092-Pyramimonas_sp.AAC.1